MFSTYSPKDVTLLLKDISGLVEPLPTEEREKRIQSGVHYSEMLPVEYEPSQEYLDLFWWALRTQGPAVAQAVSRLSERILESRGPDVVLVSLARAGTSTGVLLKRYMQQRLGTDPPHYTISIIRGRGIDDNALQYIDRRHGLERVQFVDGWTGKGAILGELRKAAAPYPALRADLAVLADPARIAAHSGTREDFLIPGSCLNSTVCGLISRTFLRSDIIGPKDFHGAAFHRNLVDHDLTYRYIDAIAAYFPQRTGSMESADDVLDGLAPLCEVQAIADRFRVQDINLVKPGVGEATRVLLRRVPWKILVHSLDDDKNLGHLYTLAREKNVPVEEYPLQAYRAVGLIRHLKDV